MAKNFVPQTGQVRAPGSLTGSSTDLSDSAFTGAFDELFKRFPFYKLHCVEITVPGSTQMEHRGHIRVTDARRCAGFTQKAKLRRLITKISI
jgi:hypothetical protein